ncbi:MAG: PLDc_N domain-containing protein [Candidatus Heimdallarchaeota archaeon]|nr:PLDc_N domain-containing protein [Candidatus Heimdallarchaeota archaeon]
MNINELLPIILPLVILQLSIMLIALRDWLRQPKDMTNKMIWLVIIILVNTIGPLMYFMVAPRVSTEDKWLEG